MVADSTVAADEDIFGHRLSEYFDLQNVGDDFLCFSVNVRVYESDVVVAGYHVSESTEPLLDPLERDRVREGVS